MTDPRTRETVPAPASAQERTLERKLSRERSRRRTSEQNAALVRLWIAAGAPSDPRELCLGLVRREPVASALLATLMVEMERTGA